MSTPSPAPTGATGFQFDPALLDPPWDLHTQLRLNAPVCHIEALGFHLVTKHEDITQILKDPVTFSSHFPDRMGAGFSFQPRSEAKAAVMAKGYDWKPTLFFTDAPEHRRQRALFQTAFSPRRVRQIETDLRNLTEELIDGLDATAVIDFQTEVAALLPVLVISDALGIEKSVRTQFMGWADSIMRRLGEPLTEEEDLPLLEDFVEAQHYFAKLIADRREHPTDDLLSDLVHAQLDSEEPLTLEELLSVVTLIPVAGSETSAGLIGMALLHLIEQPELMARCREDHDLIDAVIEETLRFESPVQAWFRMTTRDVTLSQTEVPAGSMLLLVLASGNRDEDAFECPAEFRTNRENIKSHVAFGRGPHFCIGSNLARAEARIAVETMLNRFAKIDIAPGRAAKFHPNLVHRSLETLPVTVTAA